MQDYLKPAENLWVWKWMWQYPPVVLSNALIRDCLLLYYINGEVSHCVNELCNRILSESHAYKICSNWDKRKSFRYANNTIRKATWEGNNDWVQSGLINSCAFKALHFCSAPSIVYPEVQPQCYFRLGTEGQLPKLILSSKFKALAQSHSLNVD